MAQSTDSYKCEICSLTFNSDEELKEHERSYHQGGNESERMRSSEQNPASQRNPGSPNFQRESGSERKSPGSERQEQEDVPASPKRAAR